MQLRDAPQLYSPLDPTQLPRQLIRAFGTASIVFGAISLFSGLSVVSCALQITAGAYWLRLTGRAEDFSGAVVSGRDSLCCGCSNLAIVRGLSIAGNVFAVLEGLWIVGLFGAIGALSADRGSSSSGNSYYCSTSGFGRSCSTYSYGTCIDSRYSTSSSYYATVPWFGCLTGHAAVNAVANLCLNSASLAIVRAITDAGSSGSAQPAGGGGRSAPSSSVAPYGHYPHAPPGLGYGAGAQVGYGFYGPVAPQQPALAPQLLPLPAAETSQSSF